MDSIDRVAIAAGSDAIGHGYVESNSLPVARSNKTKVVRPAGTLTECLVRVAPWVSVIARSRSVSETKA